MKTNLYIFKKYLLVLLFTLASALGWGQITIVSDGLNNSTTLFTVSGGTYFTGNSATGDRPASSPFAVEGTHSYGISNGTATLTSNSNIDTSIYSGVTMSLRLASFSIGGTGNGADPADIVTVEVSPDGGTTYYSTVRVLGPTANNAYWAYSTGTGNASTAYDGNATPVDFQPAGTGNRTTDGYSTITITSLPSITNLRFRITLVNNAAGERWVIDDFKVQGTIPGKVSTGNGDWNVAGTWSPSGVPTATDNVTILAGHTVTTYTANGVVTRDATTTVNGTLALGNGLDGTTSATINGTLQLNSNGYTTTSPKYTSGSTLKYNSGGNYGRYNEWNQASGTLGTTAGYPDNVQISNNTTLNFPNGSAGPYKLDGILTIDIGSTLDQSYNGDNAALIVGKDILINGTLKLGGAINGDITVGGNWTDNGTFTPNSRAVTFNGIAEQTVTNTSVFLDGHFVEIFDFLNVAGSGTLKLGTDTNIRVIAANGLKLSSTNATSTIDLNGNTFNYNGGGNLDLNNGNRYITNSNATTGYFRVADANVTATNLGTITFQNNANLLIINASYNPGSAVGTIINSSLLMKNGGSISTNTIKYGTNSTLKYSTDGNIFHKGLEWNATTNSATSGLPYNVQVMDNTTLDYTSSVTNNQFITNNLTIDNGSSFYMDYDFVSCGGYLSIGNNLISAGNMTLGYAFGDDLKVGNNITFNTGYTFDAKGRAVFFTKSSGNQVITASSKPTFHYVVFESANNLVRLAAGTSLDITAPNGGNVISFNASTNIFDINDGNTLTLGTSGVANNILGSGTFTTGANATPGSMVLLGNGSIGTLKFSGNQNLANFTINRQAGTLGVTLGSDLKVSTSLNLTNGIVDLGANLLTLGSSSGAGTLTGGSANSYIIADRTAGGRFKIFTPNVTSYTFPIGDSISSPGGTQYSPATINLTAATLTSSSYLQMNVEDAIEPNNAATVDYITRYWNLNGTSVTSATYNFTGTYLPVDVVGTETNSFSGRYNASAGWTEGAALASNTVSLTGLTTDPVGGINTTADTNHFSGGSPLSKAEIEIRQAGTIKLTGSTFDFGNVVAGTNLNKTFRIFNLGLEPLTLGASTLSGAEYSLFSNYTSPVPKSSNPINYSDFIIRFTPSGLGTFTGSISIPNNDISGSENPYIIYFTGVGVASAATDIITANNEQNTISSTVNNTAIIDNTKGVEVWRFTIRDGGATADADNLPSILTSLNIAKSASSSIGDFRDAIYSIALFDGSTLVGTGNVTSATQIQFTGLNINVADNTSKTLSLRLSLKCPLGAGAVDGDDFVFSISNTNATFSNTGSGSAAFSAAVSTDAKNVIDVIATHLAFTTQPMTTAVSQTMPTVKVGAVDDCGNVDRNISGTITITSTGTLLTSPLTATLTSGVATFNNIVHTVVDTNRTLSATNGTLTVVSNPFDIIASNTFERGDFVVVGVNSNIVTCSGTNPAYSAASGFTSGADEISFFSFKNIYNGDVFYITDNGYERVNAGQWGDTEGVYKFTRTGGTIGAGTVINMWLYDTTPFVTFTSPDNGWTVVKETGFAGTVVLNTGGDQIYFMQGGSWTNGAGAHDAVYNPGTILFAFNTNSSWTSFGSSTQQSGLYPGMRCFSVLPNAATDFIEYTGPVTPASRRDWIERVNNPNNWTDRVSCAGYTRMHVGQTYTILSGVTVNGLWRGSSDNNWFDCSNWDNLNVPDQTTNVSIPATATNNALISSTAVDANLYGSIAKANDISISKTLTIEGSVNNKLEVYGNLTLNAGGTLDMDDANTATQDGQIYLYNGNWTNNAGEANFLQGQSTVHFLGSTPQIINANNHASYEKFGNVVMGNNFDTSVSNNLFMDGYFTLNANKTLNIASNDFVDIAGTFSNYGAVTVQNDGNLVQREGSTYTSNNQNVSVYRNALMKRLDYNYWGAPVAAQQLKAFSPATVSSRFYEYQESDDLFYSVSWLTNFVPGKGFAIRAPNNYTTAYQTFNGAFAGVPNNGNVTQSLSYTTTLSATHAEAGYNLIANPYASNIDFDELFNDNSTLINRIAYFWTNTNVNPPQQGSYYTQENYAVYNGSGGTPSTHASTGTFGTSSIPTNIIKVGQGFMVSAKQAGTLTIKNRIRTSSINGNFFNVKTAPKDRYWLELITPVNNVNTILLAYVNGATNGFDGDYDAKLLTSASDEFYSYIAPENTTTIDKLVIQGKEAPLNIDDKVLLGANFFENGNYTIKLANKEGIFGDVQPIFLHDKLLNIYTDLQKDTYTFEATLGENNSRFEIIYNPLNALSTDDIKDKGFAIYKENKGYRIISAENMKSIEMYDASGKLINKIESNSKNHFIEHKNAYKGVYILKINTADKMYSGKIIF